MSTITSMMSCSRRLHQMFITALPAPTRLVASVTTNRWLERVGRVLPNLHIKVNDIWVKGGPWHTKVFVRWDATATLLNGDTSYFNRGFHVITMRWGKVYSLDVFEDSQEVARGLAVQAESGLEEATAEQIVS